MRQPLTVMQAVLFLFFFFLLFFFFNDHRSIEQQVKISHVIILLCSNMTWHCNTQTCLDC